MKIRYNTTDPIEWTLFHFVTAAIRIERFLRAVGISIRGMLDANALSMESISPRKYPLCHSPEQSLCCWFLLEWPAWATWEEKNSQIVRSISRKSDFRAHCDNFDRSSTVNFFEAFQCGSAMLSEQIENYLLFNWLKSIESVGDPSAVELAISQPTFFSSVWHLMCNL